ncbi:MAG: amino acid ABC transporter ATP-binding protein [Psychrobacter sp.]|uniref:amino acid ABC transporter ATP-binding protein n=1 Tax=unclassified Psychrobacter TaxID=196806 RepID=UPI001787E57E|nr:amino acid ABC transporter ATP-binding protein [Psychrobacter sp. FME5]MBE0443786.1 amino acid ABC transporter ATP-binding protein [Psychrobacter sp. FME5]MDN5801578.1 amino acid ABC transporter ATP-binding protein [Psychrobacter sp.]MDN5891290.1 amino acid ABC transporter ATP-binding protein [Psychrobacter sp.]MDN5897875.1 amino acid ABC transporter ATP-binding protein [Psychrobacter sp.]
MIQVSNIHKAFGSNQVLKGIDLTIHKGKVVVILGPSGSGKTTFLRCLNALEIPDQGVIAFDDGSLTVDFAHKPNKKTLLALQRKSGMVFQSYNLFPHKTAIENLMLGPTVVQGQRKAQAREQAVALLDKVGLSDKANLYPFQLSGGQQQRIGIARALAIEPSLLLFDEPTSALDPELVQDVLGTMKQLASEGWTMVVVTHEINFARDVADHVVLIEDGYVVEEGSAEQMFELSTHPRTQAFLQRIQL